jgi:hypothetical protein
MLQALQRRYGQAGKKGPCAADAINIPAAERPYTHVALALVPDPVHTSLALHFDREVEALQQAAQDNEWVFDEAQMPWDNKDHPESSDSAERKLAEIARKNDEVQPGFIFFHHAPKSDASLSRERLLIFVVGETPTGGVEKEQFRNADEIMQQLFRDGSGTPSFPSGPFPILGPSFSGSLESLVQLLACAESERATKLACRERAAIFSGTVSDESSVTAFNHTMPESNALQTLQQFDVNAIRRFLEFAQDKKYDLRHIAILSEDETAYGASAVSSDSAGAREPEKDVAHFYFPREISQLRNAYQHSVAADTQNDKSPHSTLPLNLESSGSNDDSVREYSRNQLPLSQEAVLLGIIAELRKHDSELIILRSTDPFDQLFLARFIGQAYPQGRIITMGADLLFSREVQDARLHGVMALSTYDLTPGTEHEFVGKGEPHSDRVFPSSNSIGTYNAMALLLVRIPLDDVDKQPQTARSGVCVSARKIKLIGYGDAFHSSDPQQKITLPPVHLSVLGHEGFWHLATLPDGSPQGKQNPATAHLANPDETEFPKDWQLFWLLSLAVSLAYAYFVWTASMFSTSESVAHLAPPVGDSRKILFAVTGYLHFALLCAVSMPYLNVPNLSAGNTVQSYLLLLIMVVVAVVCGADLSRRSLPRLHIVLFVVSCLATFWVFAQWQLGYGEGLTSARSVRLTSGISPLLPILLLMLGGLWGAWYSLSGASLVGHRCPILPRYSYRNEFQDVIAKALHPLLEENQLALRKFLDPTYVDPASVMISVLVLLVCGNLAGIAPFRTLEGRGYEVTLAILVALLLVFLVAGIIRMAGMWGHLRRLLQALNLFRLGSGFKALNGFSWAPLWRLGPGDGLVLRKLVRQQVETVTKIEELKLLGSPDFSEELKTHKQHVLEAWWQAEEHSTHLDTMSMLLAPIHWFSQIREQGKRETHLLGVYLKLRVMLARVTFQALAYAFTHNGSGDNVEEGGSSDQAVAKAILPLQLLPATEQEKQEAREKADLAERLQVCRELIASLYTNFIIVVLIRIRTLIVSVAGLYIFLLLALSIYPFQPRLGIRLSLMVLLGAIVGVVGKVYAQMHRDTILSYITDTRPGELGSDFWVRILAFVALPLTSLLASQFPEISSSLMTWLEPAMKALK